MPKVIKRVKEMVDAEVVRDKTATTASLRELAQMLDDSIASLSLKEFQELYEDPARGASDAAPPRQKRSYRKRKKSAATTKKSEPKAKAQPKSKAKTKSKAKPKSKAKTTRKAKSPRRSAQGRRTSDASPPPSEAATDSNGSRAPADRDAIRAEMMAFAKELTAAVNDPTRLVGVLAGVDARVNRIADAVN